MRYGLEVLNPVDGAGTLHRGGREVRRTEHLRGQRRRSWPTCTRRGTCSPTRRLAPPQLPALLALPPAGDLPGHRPVVPLARSRRAARPDARRDRPGPLDPGLGARAHPQHDRAPARLVPVAPAHLGRAHRGLLLREVRRAAGLPGAHAAGGRRVREGGHRGLVPPRPGALHAGREVRQLRRRRLPARAGHPRRLVGLGRLLGGGGRARQEQPGPGQPLPGGLRPAPRLVPLVAPHLHGHPRQGALRGRAHPRLRPRRPGARHVEERGQRGGAGGDHQEVRRRHPAALGGRQRLPRRRAGLRPDPRRPGRGLPQDPQHRALGAREPGRLRPGPGLGAGGRDGALRPLGLRQAGRVAGQGLEGLRRLRVPRGLPRHDGAGERDPLVDLLRRGQGPALHRAQGRQGSAQRADGAPHGGAGPAPHARAGALLHRARGLEVPARPAGGERLRGRPPEARAAGRRGGAHRALRQAAGGADRGAEGAGGRAARQAHRLRPGGAGDGLRRRARRWRSSATPRASCPRSSSSPRWRSRLARSP